MQAVDPTRVLSRFSTGGYPQAIELVCPHCLKEVTFAPKVWQEHGRQAAIAEVPCPCCGENGLFIQLLDHNGVHKQQDLYVYPAVPGRESMPGVEQLRALSGPIWRTYESALKLYNHAEWGPSALTVRHLLGSLVTRLLGDDRRDLSLAGKLEALAREIELSRPLQGIAELLAPGGSFARQFENEAEIDAATAEQLLELAEQLICYLVVLPGTMAELKSRIATAPVPIRRGGNAA
jgi:hypothetical protein